MSQHQPRMSYATLLLILFSMLVFQAPLAAMGYGLFAGLGLSLAVLTASAFAVSGKPALRYTAALLLALPLGAELLMRVVGTTPTLIFGTASLAAYLAFIVAVILRNVLGGSAGTLNSVLGGACVYLLLGTVFYLVFCVIETAAPGSFATGGLPIADLGGAETPEGRYPDLLYFSFVTLTTLGYGDVVPVSTFARSVATATAVIGQLYLAIMLAGLVSLHLLGRKSD